MKKNGSLNRHIVANHEGAKFECDKCGKQMTQTQHLRRHTTSLHKDAKNTNLLPQISQTQSLTPLCSFLCTIILSLAVKVLRQISHL